ncbi:hypothetical protein [Halobacillus sp. BBL2006]|uniref:hypothetical protein n=1 Tax=Halobacillus sp. BBL2006 TaxID=1543706 RepID=UPI000543606C|nr:hypothetical protein [Halobacillus sp. BBL2006]KHE72853.1 hypothetical protein LD39_02380 [Halobacillus sp. BBL2006]
MTYKEAVEILKTIEEFYGDKFPLTKRKITLIIAQLEKMEYEPVMTRLSEHVLESPFPPTLSDIAVYHVPDDGMVEKMQQWKKEAAEVPEETKRLFEEKMNELMRKVSE